jgi:hypothetical protein
MPNLLPRQIPKTSPIEQKVFVATKQWIYEVSEKVARSHAEARILAFLTTLWLEYLSLNLMPFSVPLDSKYIQLYALLLLDAAIEMSPELRARCSRESLIDLTKNFFSSQEVYKLQGEIEFLDMKNLVKAEPLIKGLEDLLRKLPEQTSQIRNVSLILLDAYNLQFFGFLADKKKVAAATLAVARFWVYEKEEEKWNDEFARISGLRLNDFKQEYDQVYCVAYMINQKNLAKKREEENKDAGNRRSVALLSGFHASV